MENKDSAFERDYQEAERAHLTALVRTLELRVATLEDAGMDSAADKKQLAEVKEKLERIEAQRKTPGQK